MGESLLDTRMVADQLGMSFHTVSRWRTDGEGPAFIRVANKVRYRQSDIDAWLDSQTVSQSRS